MAEKFYDLVLVFLETLYNITGPTVKTKKVDKMIKDERFKNVIPYLVLRKFIHITWKNKKNKDISSGNISHIHLGDGGVEYLMNQKNMKSQREFNLMIALTGCVIALIAIHGFVKNFLELDTGGIVILGTIFMILVIICFVPIANFIFKYFSKKY